MPEIGEVKKAAELGKKKQFTYYKWLACEVCGKERWVLLKRGEPRNANHCQGCAVKLRTPPYTHGDNPQLGDTAKGWQIGRETSITYKYAACPDCGRLAWKVLNKGEILYQRCTKCANLAHRIVRVKMEGIAKEGDIRNGYEIDKNKDRNFIWRICPDCGRGKWVQLTETKQPKTLKCNKCAAATKENSVHWRGGKYINDRGYMLIRIYRTDYYFPMAINKKALNSASVLEHRLVMAKYLGRILDPKEIVHHKNGVKTDNRIENLELTSQLEHLKSHNKGYTDGYAKGYQDGQNGKIKELLEHIKLLEWRLKESEIIITSRPC